ncbi:hypothetical protein BAX95_04900 [Elizabethkingia meningoseptica]|nr:hypothetical protein BAX95_04900 [Elizabethkingia meningoseptica]
MPQASQPQKKQKVLIVEHYNADKNIKGIIHTVLMCRYFSNLCNSLQVERLCNYVVFIFRHLSAERIEKSFNHKRNKSYG